MQQSKPVLALMYDFDKTLCTKDMQEYSFIPNVNMKIEEFWSKSNNLANEKKMDRILSCMHVMLKEAHKTEQRIQREDFVKLGKDLEFFPGVEGWFERINSLGKDLGIKISHYIISSGLHEIIEGSSIYKNFDDVFASEFLYDENNVACWPKNAVNYTSKTQFLFRINKGILDISNDDDLNKYTHIDERPIPFRNMIYIGDGLTDVPCMKLVKTNGGYSIAVYQKRKKTKVEELIQFGRVDFLALADYSENSELDKIVCDMICKIAMVESLKKKSTTQIAAILKKQSKNLRTP